MITSYVPYFKILAITVLANSIFSVANASDEAKEQRFHEIYKKYNSSNISDSDWEKVIGNRKSQSYKVQKGDTLWDVSKTFFGDNYYWPKIWGLNSGSIYNPHLIDPSLEIRFYPGTVLDAPTVKLTKEKVTATKGSLAGANEEAEIKSNVNPNEITNENNLPKTKRKIKPIVKELPESLPVRGYTVQKAGKFIKDFNVRPIVHSQSANMDLSQFVTDRMPPSVGEVVGTELELKSASDFQYIFIKTSESLVGRPVVAIQNLGKLKSADSWGSSILAEIQGEIEVKEISNPDKGIYRALVKRTVNPVQVGAQLIVGVIPKFNTGLGGITNKTVMAQLMGSSSQEGRGIHSTGHLVFINAGSSKGFSEGDVLPIYPKIDSHYEKLNIKSDRISGLVRIVKVEDSVCTGYIIKSVREVFPGDWVGSTDVSTLRHANSDEEEETQTSSANDQEEELMDNSTPSTDSGDASSELEEEVL